ASARRVSCSTRFGLARRTSVRQPRTIRGHPVTRSDALGYPCSRKRYTGLNGLRTSDEPAVPIRGPRTRGSELIGCGTRMRGTSACAWSEKESSGAPGPLNGLRDHRLAAAPVALGSNLQDKARPTPYQNLCPLKMGGVALSFCRLDWRLGRKQS